MNTRAFLISGYKPSTSAMRAYAMAINGAISGVYHADSERITVSVNPQASADDLATMADALRRVYEDELGWKQVKVSEVK